ncbi:biotin-dependent carboxyltransferase family protein [Pelagibacterium sp.]|uniref:5-oxoprolinase subunit C family protein n=1 Tax=Pelagibacterium sp. TaxID=1967288 RepID=UPI003A8D31AE
MSRIVLSRVGPMTTIQDTGRPGLFAHGIGGSGPMDRAGYVLAGDVTAQACGAAIEIGPLGLDFTYYGAPLLFGAAGGEFSLTVNGSHLPWPTKVVLTDNTEISIKTGPQGNYAYLRFASQIGVPLVLGSRSTNATVGLGGLDGRTLRAGDDLELVPLNELGDEFENSRPQPVQPGAPIRFIWGIHAELFTAQARAAFISSEFRVSARMDRMGVKLQDTNSVFADAKLLNLVSDAVVPGDIQILGDGTPIVLMRDCQPTGGYPRIGTIIDADLDRFAQIRPGKMVSFSPVTVAHAHRISKWQP